MSTRIFSAAIFALTLAGCGPESAEPAGEAMDCSIAGAKLARVCTLEITGGATGSIAVIHHPDGGFRRVNFARGKGFLQPVDGSALARIVREDAEGITFAVEDDEYVLPAKLIEDGKGE